MGWDVTVVTDVVHNYCVVQPPFNMLAVCDGELMSCSCFFTYEVQTFFIIVVCHGLTGSPSALSGNSKRGVTVLEGGRVLARGTGCCT